jgi:hypothetical protein
MRERALAVTACRKEEALAAPILHHFYLLPPDPLASVGTGAQSPLPTFMDAEVNNIRSPSSCAVMDFGGAGFRTTELKLDVDRSNDAEYEGPCKERPIPQEADKT